MNNTIDHLWDMAVLDMTPDDITSLIDYYRQQRINYESGVKPKKETGPSLKIDLAELGLIKSKPSEPIKRRF